MFIFVSILDMCIICGKKKLFAHLPFLGSTDTFKTQSFATTYVCLLL